MIAAHAHRCYKRARGFTLVELLIVVIILAILAAIVVPQFSSSTTDARESALDSTLTEMRNALELYYHQHGGNYPSATADGGGNAAGTVPAFLNQLTQYTDINGTVNATRTAVFKYGPYVKKQEVPMNPIDESNAMVINSGGTEGDITATGTDAGGWWYDKVSGKFIANIAAYYTR